MATTLTALRAQCRLLLASTTAWPNATLDAFIADAIRAYSAELPRVYRNTLALTTGTQAYALPGAHGFLGVVSVEYPAGEDPPEFLYPVAEWSAEFGAGAEVYALRGVADNLAIESDTSAGWIVFAETVATGESAVVAYHGLHRIPNAGDDAAQITVPEAHWDALIAFVDFRCHWELESDEAIVAASTSIVLAQLGEDGRRTWNRWREVMGRLTATQVAAVWLPWADERIY